jgi:hypothetical protein
MKSATHSENNKGASLPSRFSVLISEYLGLGSSTSPTWDRTRFQQTRGRGLSGKRTYNGSVSLRVKALAYSADESMPIGSQSVSSSTETFSIAIASRKVRQTPYNRHLFQQRVHLSVQDAAIPPEFGSLVLERYDQGASSSRFASVLCPMTRKRVA